MRHRCRLGALFAVGLAACGRGDPGESIGTARARDTVDAAAGSSCSTTVVEGLSVQIVGQSNCDAPGAFLEVQPPSNVAFGGAVFPYLEQPAHDSFLAATNGNGMTMTVNSMLRTVAQQYLLYRWYQSGTCGIGLAATPGTSN